MKLDIKAVALTAGILTGLCKLLLGWGAAWLNIGNDVVKLYESFTIGYNASFVGGIIGAIWGFVFGLIGGAIFAWLYNKLAK